jgi:hypothetical protein
MNKFEKLIEYIINDEDDKARALFHDIVVEKSRDIYESIMDEEQMGEMVHGGEVEDMVDEIGDEEAHMESNEEFDMDGAEDDGMDDTGAEDDFGGDEFGGDDDMGAEPEGSEMEMNIDAKLDELLAKFDEIMGDDAMGDKPADDGMGDEEPAFGGDEGHEEMGDAPETDKMGMMEGEQPEWLKKGSGKSGSAKSGKSGSAASGKSGSAKMEAAKAGSAVSGKSGKSGKSGSGKMEGKKSTTELMREYVDKIQDMNLTGDAEGTAVGAAGKKAPINNKSVGLSSGPDFGGTSENIVTKKGNTNEVPDGKPVPKANNEYTKGQGEIKSGNVNFPGGNAGKSSFKKQEPGHGAEKNGDKETGKVVGSNQSGKPTVNKKPIEGAAGQPTGKKQ